MLKMVETAVFDLPSPAPKAHCASLRHQGHMILFYGAMTYVDAGPSTYQQEGNAYQYAP